MYRRQYYLQLTYIIVTIAFTNAVYAERQDTSICNGNSILLTSLRGNADKYLWSTGEEVKSITVKPTASSLYTVFSINGKDTLRDSIFVKVLNFPEKPLISFKDSSLLTVNPSNYAVRWYKNNLLQQIKSDTLRYPAEGVYKVSHGNASQCWTVSDPIYLTNDHDSTKYGFDILTFPNPSTGYFNLNVSLSKKIAQEVRVRVVHTGGTVLFDQSYFIYQTDYIKIPVDLPYGTKGQIAVAVTINNKTISKTHIIN